VHHAHQKGIIHRDIKPSNILVSMHGDRAVPKIIDFGIAKAAASSLTEKTMFTFQGQLLGTPEYMSPEQVDLATQDIDTRSDIYSLGVVLYELLAGVLPFERESLEKIGFSELQRTLREQEPASPSVRLSNLGEKAKAIADSRMTQVVPLARRLHRELEWIPVKAMRKDRCRRYKSASDMADDIQSYLNGNPLLAGPETAIYRMQKFVHKHAGSVATAALVSVAVILGLVVSVIFGCRAEQARQKEAAARIQVEQALARAENAEKATKEKAEELRRTLYVNSIQLADAKHREGNAKQVRSLLDSCPGDLRGWEWKRLNYTLDQSAMTIHTNQDGFNHLALSHDGKRIATSGRDKTIKLLDVTSGSELVTIGQGEKRATSRDLLYKGDFNGYRLAISNVVGSLAFNPNGEQIASGHWSGEIKIWDAATGTQLKTLGVHKDSIVSIAFSPDGKQIISGSDDHTIKLWDAMNGIEVATLQGHESGGVSVAFSPDGKQIASRDYDGKILVWDTVTCQKMWSDEGLSFWAKSVSFSPDGKLLASGVDNDVKIWDATTGSNLMTLRGHEAPVCAVIFSPDGKYLASCGYDNMIKVWNLATGETTSTLRGHEKSVYTVVFTPDGKSLVSGSWDGTVKIWDMVVTRELTRLVGHDDIVWFVAFSPDGKRLVSAGASDGIKIWDVQSATELNTFRSTCGWTYATSVAFSPNGTRLASGNRYGTYRIWDVATGDQITSFRRSKALGSHLGVAFSPDGQLVASPIGGSRQTVKVWNANTGKEVMTLDANEFSPTKVAFSPDGKFIASGGSGPNIKVWEWETGREFLTLRGHDKGIITSVAFSPDGKRIVSSCQEDYTVKLWDAMSGTELITLKHADVPTSAAFSPDGSRIISGCRDGTARVWDATTGAELLTLRAGSGATAVAFSPDGKTIACGLWDHTIAIWESVPPPGGYDQRKIGKAARNTVDELHEKHGLYHDVIDQLQNNMVVDSIVRKLALQIANSRKLEDREKLQDELERKAWKVIVAPDRDVQAYRAALEEAGKADALEPNYPPILTTLGAGQYRVGSYENALTTLTKVERILSDAGEEPDPWNLAFKAMTLHKLGRLEEAKAALEQLRKLTEDWQVGEATEVVQSIQALLTEAEKLIVGEK
jgi:WD40 repeat protein